jgi:ribose 5-phosphate isomerase B
MAANKVVGARAALCNDPYYARLARRDNDANILAFGARVVAPEFAFEILEVWISTKFAGGRHKRRIDLIADYERRKR